MGTCVLRLQLEGVFLLWVRMLRLLSVSKRLGPFVILVVSMGQDIGLFAVVYAIFLAAFSVLIRGSMPLSYQHCTGGPDDPEPYKCWDTWWVVRTFIQASGGDIYMDDMKTDASVFGLMALWVIMNLLLCTSLPSSIPDSYPADCILLALAHHGVVRCSSARAIHSQPRGSISVFTFAAEHGSL